MKKTTKIIIGTALVCGGCAAIYALVCAGKKKNDFTDECENYDDWYNSNPEYSDLCRSLDREGEGIPKTGFGSEADFDRYKAEFME